MKYIISILCIQCFLFSVYSQVNDDTLCFRLTQFEEIRGNKLRYTSDSDHICSNFIINEMSADSNCIIRLFKFENAMYEGSYPGFILTENDNVEIYDILAFSNLIDRVINSDIKTETLKTWITLIINSYYKQIYEINTSNMIIKFNKGNCDFHVTLSSMKRKF